MKKKNIPFTHKGFTVDYIQGSYRAEAYTYDQLTAGTKAGIKKAINKLLKN